MRQPTQAGTVATEARAVHNKQKNDRHEASAGQHAGHDVMTARREQYHHSVTVVSADSTRSRPAH